MSLSVLPIPRLPKGCWGGDRCDHWRKCAQTIGAGNASVPTVIVVQTLKAVRSRRDWTMSGAQVVDRVWLWCRCKPNAAHHESRPNKIQPQMSTDDANCD